MKAILPDVRQLELRRTVFVSVIGVLLVCLLALLANQLKQAIIANKKYRKRTGKYGVFHASRSRKEANEI